MLRTAFVVILFFAALPIRAQTPDSVEKQLTDLRAQLNDALLRKDRAFMERTLADEYYCIHSNGIATTKREEITAWMAMTAYSAVQTTDHHVRVYGTVAIVNGRTANKTAEGRPAPASVFTDLFVKRDGRWQLVGCQATRLPSN